MQKSSNWIYILLVLANLGNINNNNIAFDGTNVTFNVTGQLSMNNKAITSVLDPVNNQDAATKNYIDTTRPLPANFGQLPYANGLNAYSWKDYASIDATLSEGNFDNLPNGTYAILTSRLPATRLGILSNTTCYLQVMNYDNTSATRNKRYKVTTLSNFKYMASFTNSVWNTWTADYPKNVNGHIPILEANISQTGFIASATSNGTGSTPYGTFNTPNADLSNGSWFTSSSTTGWLQIQCPIPVIIWKFAIKARGYAGRNITAWNLTGSNDGISFTTLLNSTVTLNGSDTVPTFLTLIHL
jgi:hypothetical protein